MATAAATTIEFPDGLNEDGEPQVREQYAVLVSSPVRMDQLDYEITHGMNWRKSAGLSSQGDPRTASTDEPVVLYVVRSDEIDNDLFLRTVTNHDPDAEWHSPHAEPVEGPSFEESIDWRDAAESGDAEIRAVLRGLLAG